MLGRTRHLSLESCVVPYTPRPHRPRVTHILCVTYLVPYTHPVSHPLSHAHRSCPMHPVSHVPRVIYTSCCTHSGVTHPTSQPLSRSRPRAGHHLFLEQILWSARAQTRVCEIVLSVELQQILAQVEMWLSLVPAPVARQGKVFHSLKRALGVFSRARSSIPQLLSKKLELSGGAGAESALKRRMAALTARGGPRLGLVWAPRGLHRARSEPPHEARTRRPIPAGPPSLPAGPVCRSPSSRAQEGGPRRLEVPRGRASLTCRSPGRLLRNLGGRPSCPPCAQPRLCSSPGSWKAGLDAGSGVEISGTQGTACHLLSARLAALSASARCQARWPRHKRVNRTHRNWHREVGG